MGTRRTVIRTLAVTAGGTFALGVAAAPGAFATTPVLPEGPGAQMRASAIVNWHLSPSLAALRTEINTRWPNRDRSSDGAIGDARHQARTNSHNPAGYPGGPSVGTRGAVHALDITARGIDVDLVLSSVIGDPRVWYVIHDGRIWSSSSGWAPRLHPGDPHTTHIHVNLREDSQAAAVQAETDTRRWLGGSGARGASAPTSRSTATTAVLTTQATRDLQRALIARGFAIPSGPTGWYGPETTRAVQAFQVSQGWRGAGADGIAGPTTLRRLGVSAGAPAAAPATSTTVRAAAPKAPASSADARYRPGTASREVYFLQEALIKRGYSIPAGPTGYFGGRTVDAVKAFQRAQGWSKAEADGIPGPRTLALLGLA